MHSSFIPTDGFVSQIQCFGTGLDPHSTGSLDPDLGRQNDTQKRKRLRNVMFWCDWYSLRGAGGFSCSLKAIHIGLEIFLHFLIKKFWFSFQLCIFWIFCHWKPGSGSVYGSEFCKKPGSGSGFSVSGFETLLIEYAEITQDVLYTSEYWIN